MTTTAELEVERDGGTTGTGRAATRPAGPRCDVCRHARAVTVCVRCARPLCWEHDGLLVAPEVTEARDVLRRRRRSGRPTSPSPAPPSRGRGPGSSSSLRRDRADSRDPDEGRAGTSSTFRVRHADGGSRASTAQGTAGRGDTGPTDPLAERDWRDHGREVSADELHLCPTCLPIDRAWSPEMVGAALAVALGIMTAAAGVLAADGPDPALVVVGVLLLATGALRRVRCRRRARGDGLPARDLALPPVRDPHLSEIRHVERATADLRLFADGTYERRVRALAGSVELDASWTRRTAARGGAERDAAADGTPEVLRAGHVILCGPGDVTFASGPGVEVAPTHQMIATLAPRAEDHPVLGAFGEGHDARWPVVLPYAIGRRGRAVLDRIRLDVVPTLVPGSGRHGLDLEISWRTEGPASRRFRPGPPLVELELVRIEVPARWGRVEARGDTSGRGPAGSDGGTAPQVEVSASTGQRTITWRDVSVGAPSAVRTHRLSLRFARPVNTDDEITGRVEARFAGAVSGTTGTLLLGGGGAARRDFRPERRTTGRHASASTLLVSDLRLALGGLTYQDMRSVPDRLREEDYGSDQHFAGVVPGHDTVARLADELGAAEYYVKRIIENTPQAGRAGTLARSWDVGGRRYNGVYPVDFDLAIAGEEPPAGEGRGAWLEAKLDVRGAFADAGMRERIGQERENLWALIVRTLRGDTAAGGGPGAPGDGERILTLLDEARREGRITADDHRRISTDVVAAFASDDPVPDGPASDDPGPDDREET